MPQPDHVTALGEGSEDDLPEALRPYVRTCRDTLGFVPSLLRAWLLRPERMRHFVAAYDALMLGPSGLSTLEREMIAVAVSAANRCYHDLVVHGAAVRRLSEDPELGEMMALNYRVAQLPARQREMLDFAVRLTERPHEIAQSDRDALSAQGFSDADLFDIAEVAAFFNYTNRMAHALDVMPSRELHAASR